MVINGYSNHSMAINRDKHYYAFFFSLILSFYFILEYFG